MIILFIINVNAKWVQTGSMGIVLNINCFAVNNTTLFAGIDTGIYTTINNGISWEAANTGLPKNRVHSLVITNKNIFAGTIGAGVYLSTNNGANWSAVNNGIPSTSTIYSMVAIDTNVFASATGGIYRTTNNGLSWVLVNNMSSYGFTLAADDSNIFAGAYQSIYVSSNNGANWTSINNSGFPTNAGIFAIAVGDGKLFASTDSGVYISINNGNTWNKANTGLSGNWVVKFTISDTIIFAGTNNYGVYMSSINNINWLHVNLPQNSYISALISNDSNIFAGTLGGGEYGGGYGIYLISNNGANYKSINNGLPQYNPNVYALAFNGTDFFVGTHYYGVFKSSDNALSWTRINKGLENVTSIFSFAFFGTRLFTGANNGIYFINNQDSSWNKINGSLQLNSGVNTFLVNNTDLFAGTLHSGIFKSTDSGSNWTAVNSGIPNMADSQITSFAVNGSTIFACSINGGIFRSINNGNSWSPIDSGLPFGVIVLALAVCGTNIFAATNQVIYKSLNNGSSWAAVNSGLPAPFGASSFAVNGNNLFAITSAGISLTTNNGFSWTTVDTTGLPTKTPRFLTIYDKDLFTGIWMSDNPSPLSGIYRRPLSEMLPTNITHIYNMQIVTEINIGSNNTIKYILPKDAFTSLQIYNLEGKLIFKNANEWQQKGPHLINISTKFISMGTYMLVLNIDNFRTQQRLTIMH
jgi:BNR/Asp-box repeat.